MDREIEYAELREKFSRLQRLLDANYALHTTLDLDELLGLILKVATEGVRADRGTVFLLSEDGKELWSKVVGGDGKFEIRLPVGKGIAGAVAATGETVRLEDVYEDPRFDRSWDQKSGYRTRQVLCAPIRNREGRIVGVFQLLNQKDGRPFQPADEEYLAAISVHASLAVENARLHRSALEKERFDREIGLAQEVQRQLQPETRKAARGVLTMAGLNELCEDASGDYYDILVDLPGGKVAVVVGDVSGHGLQAALVMAEARAFLRAFIRTADGLPAAMDLLNDFLVPDMKPSQFISLFAAVLDQETGEMIWCNAGHNAPLLCRANGEVVELDTTGRILGILPDAAYRAGRLLVLDPGDVLLLYTDGVTESRVAGYVPVKAGSGGGGGDDEDDEDVPDPGLFGEERLMESLRAGAGGDASEVLGSIRRDLRAFTGPGANADDVTMVAVKRMAK